MKRSLAFLTLLGGPLFSQELKQQAEMKQMANQATAGFTTMSSLAHPVLSAPYSATVIHESVQTLADGNRIVQKTTGTTARDSQGRTRNDASLPMVGGLAPSGGPHLTFISDPVAQTSYTLNMDEKTAHSMPGRAMAFSASSAGAGTIGSGPTWVADGPPPPPAAVGSIQAGAAGPVTIRLDTDKEQAEAAATLTMSLDRPKIELDKEQGGTRTEDLGTQVVEGVTAQGVRTTRTISAGEIGNEKPIEIVTEVWTSLDLKTVILSKRSDPRFGEQTFRLTNIVRAEPDPALFTVPADFKVDKAGQNVFFYRRDK